MLGFPTRSTFLLQFSNYITSFELPGAPNTSRIALTIAGVPKL